jgi:SnoaL-like domain
METNHSITFKDADHATYNAYWVTMFTALGADTPARVGAVGRSVDDLVRVNGKWLIKVRNISPTD